MMSMTLEMLLAQRKKQVAELCGIASRDIVKHDIAADIPGRAERLRKTSAALELADSQQFNEETEIMSRTLPGGYIPYSYIRIYRVPSLEGTYHIYSIRIPALYIYIPWPHNTQYSTYMHVVVCAF